MNVRRPRRALSSAATMALAFLACLLVLEPSDFGLTAQEPPPVSLTETAVPPVGTVTTAPPSTVTVETTVQTSPVTARTAIEGGFLPIESKAGPKREMDEGDLLNIFADPTIARKLLYGRKPYIYNIKGRRDPMVIPWIRSEIVNKEHLAQAQAFMADAERQTDQDTKRNLLLLAIGELDSVIKTDPTDTFGKSAQALKDKARASLDKIRLTGGGPVVVATKAPELPNWVANGTKAILYDQSPKQDHVVLVGDEVLHLGDVLRREPKVKVAQIDRNQVVYEYENARFTVKVQVEIIKE